MHNVEFGKTRKRDAQVCNIKFDKTRKYTALHAKNIIFEKIVSLNKVLQEIK